MILARDALKRLQDGNRRFVAGAPVAARAPATGSGEQEPFAIVLGCADSRVPPEIVFDQGIGDLFVIRVAGNVATPSQIGSVEFAAEKFGSRLVVVLGHSRCGAVLAALDGLRDGASEAGSQNLRAIVDRVRPAVAPLLETEPDEDALVRSAVRANIEAQVRALRSGSDMLGGLEIVCAQYSLETGEVTFFENLT